MPLQRIYRGAEHPHDGLADLPAPPPWRAFDGGPELPTPEAAADPGAASAGHRAATFRPTPETVELVNAALHLRRPLLVTGPPGSGKSSLPYAVARELGLGPVLRWNITSRSALRDGLYQYDPLSRLYAANQAGPDGAGAGLEEHLRLGPLGTALLPYRRPRVLLIDEIDKGDLDLPNDLLHVLEDGQYEIDELVRAAPQLPEAEVLTADGLSRARVRGGRVRCRAFPFTVLTSNAEREFPAAFLRRCVVLELRRPEGSELEEIVRSHLPSADHALVAEILQVFLDRRAEGELATDQLLNAIYLTARPELADQADRAALAARVMPYLSRGRDDDDF
ncbi:MULTISPECIES: MoxR family ATPase [unclassified Kitasatospora]|uniref:AAA family ATPase n=1 Tax=unclassified Kitasatospora TaxID=2633591 RepID=UPI00070BB420|nr:MULTISPECIES: MoxR family ATPase [unclassified Kitasatospora]KQV05661.1 AAA family ATPase [Kitasatospora sp. Root107]KRB62465.1 AAA family ATPase [Kitasatospora sp. Root187]